MVALMNGKRPVVVPRLHRFREAVDDHQQEFGRRFGADGHVVYVEDPADLPAALGSADTKVTYTAPPDPLANDLRSYIDSVIGRNGRAELERLRRARRLAASRPEVPHRLLLA